MKSYLFSKRLIKELIWPLLQWAGPTVWLSFWICVPECSKDGTELHTELHKIQDINSYVFT